MGRFVWKPDWVEKIAKQEQILRYASFSRENALELGNRTLMMDGGRIVLDVSEPERRGLTVSDLLERFRAGAGKNLDSDRILLEREGR